jgi:hypothetical protein
MMTRGVPGVVTVLAALAVAPAAALAEGAVKVECWGRCDLVNLGQICDSYSVGSLPVAIACDDTSVGSGISLTCGGVTCRPWGSLLRSDPLSAYCNDGPDYDAIVTCRPLGTAAALPASATSKADDGEGQQK